VAALGRVRPSRRGPGIRARDDRERRARTRTSGPRPARCWRRQWPRGARARAGQRTRQFAPRLGDVRAFAERSCRTGARSLDARKSRRDGARTHDLPTAERARRNAHRADASRAGTDPLRGGRPVDAPGRATRRALDVKPRPGEPAAIQPAPGTPGTGAARKPFGVLATRRTRSADPAPDPPGLHTACRAPGAGTTRKPPGLHATRRAPGADATREPPGVHATRRECWGAVGAGRSSRGMVNRDRRRGL